MNLNHATDNTFQIPETTNSEAQRDEDVRIDDGSGEYLKS